MTSERVEHLKIILAFFLLSCVNTNNPCEETCYAEHSHDRAAYDQCVQQQCKTLDSIDPPMIDPKSCWARCHDECPPTRRSICVAMCGEGKCHPSQCGDC